MFRKLCLLFPVLENVPDREGTDDGAPCGVGLVMSLSFSVFNLEELFRPLSSWGPGGGDTCWPPSPAGMESHLSGRNKHQAVGRLLLASKLPTVTKNDA